eukprot:1714895-Rhodomonas_salina.1
MVLYWPYTLFLSPMHRPGTDVRYGAMAARAICLRARYAMPGTDVAHAAICLPLATPCPVLTYQCGVRYRASPRLPSDVRYRASLWRYGMWGTELGYAATGCGGMALRHMRYRVGYGATGCGVLREGMAGRAEGKLGEGTHAGPDHSQR